MSWTDERIEQLRSMWEKGLTASQIWDSQTIVQFIRSRDVVDAVERHRWETGRCGREAGGDVAGAVVAGVVAAVDEGAVATVLKDGVRGRRTRRFCWGFRWTRARACALTPNARARVNPCR